MKPLVHLLGICAIRRRNLEFPVSGNSGFARAGEFCQRMEMNTIDRAQPSVDQSEEAKRDQ